MNEQESITSRAKDLVRSSLGKPQNGADRDLHRMIAEHCTRHATAETKRREREICDELVKCIPELTHGSSFGVRKIIDKLRAATTEDE